MSSHPLIVHDGLRDLAAHESQPAGATAATVIQHGHEGTGPNVAEVLIRELSERSPKHPEPEHVGTIRMLIVADIRERAAFGLAKYGRPLRPFDGRDSLIDAYQEALDGLNYARKAEMEGRSVGDILQASRALVFAIRAQMEADARQVAK